MFPRLALGTIARRPHIYISPSSPLLPRTSPSLSPSAPRRTQQQRLNSSSTPSSHVCHLHNSISSPPPPSPYFRITGLFLLPTIPTDRDEQKQTTFWKTFFRPLAKVLLVAFLTYQVSYLAWSKLEFMDTKEEIEAEMEKLEARARGLAEAKREKEGK
ncbi:hypothetical protein MKZ38_005261 [Zalerion maritima]|uniref:Uncharacterized protein n=1 Tax=Zalerion maritima TaxID=339359 RepID=A0AAD5WQG5_9PEZI|nr:hypothetical protein MKZ38_005261 [Zalerion maritima]